MVEKKRSEAGYNLVILMVTMTLLNIALAIALPKWSQVIRRDREEELISRGFQYAEAIRVFQNRFQRLPVRLEELVEVEPRSLRRLWKDPMTEDGKWALISPNEGGPGFMPPPPPGPGQPPPPPQEENPDDNEEVDPGTGIGEKGGIQQVGPFTGVHSRSTKESILIFNGRTRYDEWRFTLEMIQALMSGGGGQLPPGSPAPGGAVGTDPPRLPNLSTRWLGRPLPDFLTAPQDGQMPGGLNNPPKKDSRR